MLLPSHLPSEVSRSDFINGIESRYVPLGGAYCHYVGPSFSSSNSETCFADVTATQAGSSHVSCLMYYIYAT